MSQWSGFYRLPVARRLALAADFAGLDDTDRRVLAAASGLPIKRADALVENVIGTFPLPLGLAVHFVVDGAEVVVPMAVEESSVVAAASHGAKLAALGGGFTTRTGAPVTLGQVELLDVPDLDAATRQVEIHADDWRHRLDATIPSMVARGGGVQRITARTVGNRLVVHVAVDCRDAMGANLVNRLCETLAPWVQEAVGGRVGLRILSNLAPDRVVHARCRVPVEALGGKAAVQAMVEANAFALEDPYRAATHNKGIMNGVDPVVLATGNDWRAVEAAVHAYAARDGTYRGLTTYRIGEDGALEAELALPVPVGIVGGVTRVHPVARVCRKLLGDPDASRLAAIIASVGLAQNLAALRALSQEGIQKGHMALHARNLALQAGVPEALVEEVARRMVEEENVSEARARVLAAALGPEGCDT